MQLVHVYILIHVNIDVIAIYSTNFFIFLFASLYLSN